MTMMLETLCADKGELWCDDVFVGLVDYSIAVRRDVPLGRSVASGVFYGARSALSACGSCHAAAIVSRHFGRVLIRITAAGETRAEFDIAEPLAVLDVDASDAPNLWMPDAHEQQADGSRDEADGRSVS